MFLFNHLGSSISEIKYDLGNYLMVFILLLL